MGADRNVPRPRWSTLAWRPGTGASSPHGYGRARPCCWSQVAAFSHSNSVGSRTPCARAKASASNQERWTTGRYGSSALERSQTPLGAEVRRPSLRSCDVVLLLPGPALIGPPLAALVAAPLDEREVGGVGDRRLADQVAADVGAVQRPLVVVGEAVAGGADRARAGRDPDQLEAGRRRTLPRRDVAARLPARSRAGAPARASAASSRCAGARGAAPSRGCGRCRRRARRSLRACAGEPGSR